MFFLSVFCRYVVTCWESQSQVNYTKQLHITNPPSRLALLLKSTFKQSHTFSITQAWPCLLLPEVKTRHLLRSLSPSIISSTHSALLQHPANSYLIFSKRYRVPSIPPLTCLPSFFFLLQNPIRKSKRCSYPQSSGSILSTGGRVCAETLYWCAFPA